MGEKSKFRVEIDKRLDELQALRDEVRLKLHLGGLEAKSMWDKLEPTLHKVEQDAEQATEVAASGIQRALADLRESYDKLRRQLEQR